MKRSFLIIVLLAWGAFELWQQRPPSQPLGRPGAPTTLSPDIAQTDDTLARAWRDRRSDVQVRGSGTVTRILGDDNDGSRHQRFILRLASGQTVLVAHNIDLAPRIGALQVGDRVGFYGEYEWNDRGGVIHWTHHDPAGRHPAGWLEHRGRRYQ